jgi:enoyl-[acyl-carrier-protein] reductase (NADH)
MSTAPEQASKSGGGWSRLLTDKVVFVTGAGGAIGSTIAQTCALHGARVVVADVNKKAADEVVTKIIDEDANKKDYVMAIELDVTSEQAIQNAVQAVVDKWNTIDVLVNKYVNCSIDSKSIGFFCLVLLCFYLVQLKMFQQKHGHRY